MPEVMLPLTVRELTVEDLPTCTWSGSATHLQGVARTLERARLGEVDYLAVCPPSRVPVAIGGVDYAKTPGSGTRGLHRAQLSVEECNPRARALYERLGYLAYGREPDSWDEGAPDGSLVRYETVCILMRKQLP